MSIRSETNPKDECAIDRADAQLQAQGFSSGCVVYRNRLDVLLARAAFLTGSFNDRVKAIIEPTEGRYIVIRTRSYDDENAIRAKVSSLRMLALN